MKLNEQTQLHKERKATKNLLVLCLMLSLAGNILVGLSLLGTKQTHRETIVPPTIGKSFWVENGKLDPNYLEAMTKYVVDLTENLAPESVELNNKLLKQLLRSNQYAQFETLAQTQERSVKKDRLSQYFVIETLDTNIKELSANIKGKRQTWMFGKLTNEVYAHLSVQFELDAAGRLWLVSVKEIPKESLQGEKS